MRTPWKRCSAQMPTLMLRWPPIREKSNATPCRATSFPLGHSRLVFSTENLTPATWPGTAARASRNRTAQRSLRELRPSDPPQSPPRFFRLREPTVPTLVLGNDFRLRTALFGVLALFALCLFVLGAVIGAWAGVVRIWPVRYSLFLLEGPPKPFVNEPESLPIALDSAGR